MLNLVQRVTTAYLRRSFGLATTIGRRSTLSSMAIGGYPLGPVFEGWTPLAALAAQTARGDLGIDGLGHDDGSWLLVVVTVVDHDDDLA